MKYLYIRPTELSITTADQFKKWLADQYDNGNAVKVYYQLDTATTEMV